MQYDLNLTPNGAQQIDVAGTYFKYAKGAGPIRVQVDGGGYVDLLPGQGMQGLKFTRLMVKDSSGAINNGALVAGDGQFIDARITGTVDVVDGGKSRTLANQTFIGGASAGPVAAQWGISQLWNKPASGKRLIVSSVMMLCLDGPGLMQLRIGLTKAASDESAGQVSPASKLLGGTASQAANMCHEGRTVSMPEVLLIGAAVAQNQSFLVTFKEPLIVVPGTGLNVNGPMNYGSVAYFEFFEEPI
jgi:hypothetical protein